MRDQIYLSALLHDIGEFEKVINEEKRNLNHAQISYEIAKELKFIREKISDMENLIVHHHNPKTAFEKIVSASDILSCREEQYEELNDKVMKPQYLRPIFLKVKENENGIKKSYSYDIKPLSLKSIFPKTNPSYDDILNQYKKLYREFHSELKLVNNEIQLLNLMEKYLWCIPIHDKEQNYDVSLYQHAKNAAAIALCLYEQFQSGYISESMLDNIENEESQQFLLINGDISGIQDFIMSVSSKGAAKSLKSHSVYLTILTDIVVKYIVDNLNLKSANLLYSGGGSFYILAPNSAKQEFEKIKKEIMKKILKAHNGDLFFAIDCVSLSPKNFVNFPYQWQKALDKTNKQKYSKWKDIDLDNKYELLFGPFDKGAEEGNHCSICGASFEAAERVSIKDEEDQKLFICRLCNSYIEFTEKLRDAKYLSIKKCKIVDIEKLNSYEDIFKSFGYEVNFLSKKKSDFASYYLLNNTSFLNEDCDGFKFGAYSLPKEKGKWFTFEEISSQSKGDKNLLGILKLDVDNLGTLFGFGLKSNKTVSRMTTFSRMMSLYFEGYVNELIKDLNMEKSIYVVYSGGDDTFLIGAWDRVLEFAEQFREKFREYVCENERITFSAGIGLFDKKHPVIRSIDTVDSSLNKAKEFRYKEENEPRKDKITILGEVFNWEEFKRINKIKSLLIETIEAGKRNKQANVGRALLYKIYKSTLGFRKILEDSNTGRVDNLRFWNLVYYLREVKAMDDKNNTSYAESIIEEYRKIVIYNITNKSKESNIRNIMIIPVAIKLAELETKATKEG